MATASFKAGTNARDQDVTRLSSMGKEHHDSGVRINFFLVDIHTCMLSSRHMPFSTSL